MVEFSWGTGSAGASATPDFPAGHTGMQEELLKGKGGQKAAALPGFDVVKPEPDARLPGGCQQKIPLIHRENR